MKDYLVRAMAFNNMVRAVAINLTNTVKEAQQRHQSNPTASAAMGRLMVASAVMSSTLKDNQKLAIQIKGNGPLGTISADCDYDGNVRGHVKNPHVIIPPKSPEKLNVAGGVGNIGMLHVTKDLGFGDPYSGSCELLSGEIADDIAKYFVVSEQIPTIFAAGVLVGKEGAVLQAGGYLIQLLPGATDDIIYVLESIIGKAKPVSTLLKEGNNPQSILEYLLGEHDLNILESKNEFRFKCFCSKDYLKGILTTLGKEDLESLLDKNETEVKCQFCNESYIFLKEDIQELINKLN